MAYSLQLFYKLLYLLVVAFTLTLSIQMISRSFTTHAFVYHQYKNVASLQRSLFSTLSATKSTRGATTTSTTSSNSASNSSDQSLTLTYADILLQADGSLHPYMLFDGNIPTPKSLSPSAAAEFKACPQSYLFQYLYGIRQPTNLALAKGSLCHSALEELFDLQPNERTLDNLQNLFRKHWSKERMTEQYGHLFDDQDELTGRLTRNTEAERKWGNEALELLGNYYRLEDPRLVPQPNPIEREIWVQAKLCLDPTHGSTGSDPKPCMDQDDNGNKEERFLVRGIVDRLDYVAVPPSPRDAFDPDGRTVKTAVRIVDYKTGKAPNFKYSAATNKRIAEENMWQLKIYALLLREMITNGKTSSKGGNLKFISSNDLRLLRLMYLTSEEGEARYLDLDLGETETERNETLQQVHKELVEIWKGIMTLVNTQDPRMFPHCDRKFCFCHKVRPKFEFGSLYQG